jgi:hypothetical protein
MKGLHHYDATPFFMNIMSTFFSRMTQTCGNGHEEGLSFPKEIGQLSTFIVDFKR